MDDEALPPGATNVRLSYTCDDCNTTTPYESLPGACQGCGRVFFGPSKADPDRACSHEDFQCVVGIARITPDDDESGRPIAFTAEIKVTCGQCGEKFRFMGLRAGMMADRPTVSVDEFELRAPIRPASADPDFGLGIPGFAIRYRSAFDD